MPPPSLLLSALLFLLCSSSRVTADDDALPPPASPAPGGALDDALTRAASHLTQLQHLQDAVTSGALPRDLAEAAADAMASTPPHQPPTPPAATAAVDEGAARYLVLRRALEPLPADKVPAGESAELIAAFFLTLPDEVQRTISRPTQKKRLPHRMQAAAARARGRGPETGGIGVGALRLPSRLSLRLFADGSLLVDDTGGSPGAACAVGAGGAGTAERCSSRVASLLPPASGGGERCWLVAAASGAHAQPLLAVADSCGGVRLWDLMVRHGGALVTGQHLRPHGPQPRRSEPQEGAEGRPEHPRPSPSARPPFLTELTLHPRCALPPLPPLRRALLERPPHGEGRREERHPQDARGEQGLAPEAFSSAAVAAGGGVLFEEPRGGGDEGGVLLQGPRGGGGESDSDEGGGILLAGPRGVVDEGGAPLAGPRGGPDRDSGAPPPPPPLRDLPASLSLFTPPALGGGALSLALRRAQEERGLLLLGTALSGDLLAFHSCNCSPAFELFRGGAAGAGGGGGGGGGAQEPPAAGASGVFVQAAAGSALAFSSGGLVRLATLAPPRAQQQRPGRAASLLPQACLLPPVEGASAGALRGAPAALSSLAFDVSQPALLWAGLADGRTLLFDTAAPPEARRPQGEGGAPAPRQPRGSLAAAPRCVLVATIAAAAPAAAEALDPETGVAAAAAEALEAEAGAAEAGAAGAARSPLRCLLSRSASAVSLAAVDGYTLAASGAGVAVYNASAAPRGGGDVSRAAWRGSAAPAGPPAGGCLVPLPAALGAACGGACGGAPAALFAQPRALAFSLRSEGPAAALRPWELPSRGPAPGAPAQVLLLHLSPAQPARGAATLLIDLQLPRRGGARSGWGWGGGPSGRLAAALGAQEAGGPLALLGLLRGPLMALLCGYMVWSRSRGARGEAREGGERPALTGAQRLLSGLGAALSLATMRSPLGLAANIAFRRARQAAAEARGPLSAREELLQAEGLEARGPLSAREELLQAEGLEGLEGLGERAEAQAQAQARAQRGAGAALESAAARAAMQRRIASVLQQLQSGEPEAGDDGDSWEDDLAWQRRMLAERAQAHEEQLEQQGQQERDSGEEELLEGEGDEEETYSQQNSGEPPQLEEGGELGEEVEGYGAGAFPEQPLLVQHHQSNGAAVEEFDSEEELRAAGGEADDTDEDGAADGLREEGGGENASLLDATQRWERLAGVEAGAFRK